MATRWETFPVKFDGGLMTNIGRLEQGLNFPGSATVLQNYEPDVNAGYTKILGYAKYSATAVTGSGQVKGVIAIDGTKALAVRSNNVYFSTGTTWASVLTLTSGSTSRIDYDSFNFNGTRKTVMVDGVNGPSIFNHDTNTMAYIPAPPSDIVGASRVAVFKSHVFFGKGRLLAFSVPYNELDYSTGLGAGVINVGDEITGLKVFRDQLIIFCLNKIYRISGSSQADFVLSPITSNTGCLAGDTVQEVGGDLMYLGPDGIRYLSASERLGDFGLTRASAKIQKLVSSATLSGGTFSSITISAKNQYRFFTYADNVLPENTKAFLGVKFSDQTADDIAWATLKGLKVYHVSKYQTPNQEVILFCSDTGFIYRMESGNSFDSSDIETIFETPYMSINDPKIRKTFYKHTAYIRPTGNFNLFASVLFDYGNFTLVSPLPVNLVNDAASATYGDPMAVYGTAMYSGVSEKEYFNNIVGSGFVVALRYYEKSQRPSHNLNFAILEYRTNERR